MQVGGVGLDYRPCGGELRHQFSQVLAAALVAQPAGDADVPVAVKVVEQLFASAGEAVHDDRAVPAVELAHDGKEVGMRVALVQRSEEHTSELQSLMRISYAVFCLKKKKIR